MSTSDAEHAGRSDVVEVDSRGQRCPLPILALGRALAGKPAGATVRLLATDPAARVDVPAFCRLRGAQLVAVSDADDGAGRYTAYLVRSLTASTPAAEPPAPARAAPGRPGAAPP